MHTRDDILSFLDDVRRDGIAYWSTFSDREFFANIGDAWSPSDNVRHLTKSIRPVTKALRLPRPIVCLMFGRPKRESMSQ